MSELSFDSIALLTSHPNVASFDLRRSDLGVKLLVTTKDWDVKNDPDQLSMAVAYVCSKDRIRNSEILI